MGSLPLHELPGQADWQGLSELTRNNQKKSPHKIAKYTLPQFLKDFCKMISPTNKCDVLNRLRKECQRKCLTQAQIQSLGRKNINENKNVIQTKIFKTTNILGRQCLLTLASFGTFSGQKCPLFLDPAWTNKISA